MPWRLCSGVTASIASRGTERDARHMDRPDMAPRVRGADRVPTWHLMETRKGRTRQQKLTAVLAADRTSVSAAAEATGIPRTTIQHWMNDPELVTYRQKTREEMGEAAKVVAWLAWEALARDIRAGKVDSRDLITAAGVAVDKSQLLSGAPTERTETLTGGLDDHERAALRDAIDAALAEAAAEGAGSDPLGTGSEVRQ